MNNGNISQCQQIGHTMTYEQCEQTRNSKNVIGTYREIYIDKEIIFICKKL